MWYLSIVFNCFKFFEKKNVNLVPNETAHREDIEETDKCLGPILKNENKRHFIEFSKKLVMTAHTHDAQTLRKCAHTFLLDQFAPGNPSLWVYPQVTTSTDPNSFSLGNFGFVLP